MRSKLAVAIPTMTLALVAIGAGMAGAVPPDPEAEITTLTESAATSIFPIMVALATGVLAIAVLWFGVRKLFAFVRSGSLR